MEQTFATHLIVYGLILGPLCAMATTAGLMLAGVLVLVLLLPVWDGLKAIVARFRV